MSKTIVLAVDVASDLPARNVAAAVLGARSRTDLPPVPFGSVSHRLLHLARRPVLVVPRHAEATERHEADETAATAS
jgi:nucleotide-binding universal stress UspA family protein